MQRIAEGPLSADLTRYLKGITFPSLKHDVIHAFRQNQAPDEVVTRLQTLPVTEFVSEEHLTREYHAARQDDLTAQDQS
jgi:hypothetical protein